MDRHLQHVIDYPRMLQRKGMVLEQGPPERQQEEHFFSLTFTVHRDLIGLVIGKKGSNINAAHAMAGIQRYRTICLRSAARCNMELK